MKMNTEEKTGTKMRQHKNENYYLDMKPKLMKDFGKMLTPTRKVLKQFDRSKIDYIVEESRREYEALIPQLPYIGGKEVSGTFNLTGSAQILAIIRPLEREGMEVHETGKIAYEMFEIYFESMPGIKKWFARKFMFSKSGIKKMKRQTEKTQLREYPAGWVNEFVEGDGANFDFGLDIVECGICKFYKEQGAEEYIPYLCLGDYPQFRAFGIGMKRTQTIGNGAQKCDFRFKKGGKASRGWPPDNLEEFKQNP